MLSLRTRRGPETGSLKTPVKTVLPCQGTSFGMPTLIDSKVPTGRTPAWCCSASERPVLALTRWPPSPDGCYARRPGAATPRGGGRAAAHMPGVGDAQPSGRRRLLNARVRRVLGTPLGTLADFGPCLRHRRLGEPRKSP